MVGALRSDLNLYTSLSLRVYFKEVSWTMIETSWLKVFE